MKEQIPNKDKKPYIMKTEKISENEFSVIVKEKKKEVNKEANKEKPKIQIQVKKN